ncbi:hypothetical protein H4J58_00165 [Colwellia sp. MB3u-70]|uniref:hypothetical protein n=1 Tax=unclassified Colwellia TaxID=196834 RepID=UPI0015F6F2C3|nr:MULTISPECIES: hypothetical protein [unclassified Colwellia]MBA6291522.1 hypothetical protein [Colwellia sp. MB3u-8]MBA6305562.1 hypothetical protein [Colwellia sp. MB3u-70]
MQSKGFYLFGSIVTILSFLIIFFEDIPYVKYDENYISVNHIENEYSKNIPLEKKAFDLAFKKQDLDMLKAIYSQRLLAEERSKRLSVKGLDVVKSIAQLIIIFAVSFMLTGLAKQREYNKKINKDT